MSGLVWPVLRILLAIWSPQTLFVKYVLTWSDGSNDNTWMRYIHTAIFVGSASRENGGEFYGALSVVILHRILLTVGLLICDYSLQHQYGQPLITQVGYNKQPTNAINVPTTRMPTVMLGVVGYTYFHSSTTWQSRLEIKLTCLHQRVSSKSNYTVFLVINYTPQTLQSTQSDTVCITWKYSHG